MGGCHGPVQGPFRIELDILVNGKVHGLFFFGSVGRHGRFQDGIAPGVSQDMLLICPASDKFIQSHFQTIQSLIIQAYKAKHIGSHGIVGIETAAFIKETKALPFLFLNQGDNFIRIFRIHHPFQPYEARVLG